jgi:glucokinase
MTTPANTNFDGARRDMVLVGDVGGTNARFALADLSRKPAMISQIRDYSSRSYARANDVVRQYLAEEKLRSLPGIATIAVAGPISQGSVRFTNLGWTLSEHELKTIGFSQVRLVNDFAALALATPHLESGSLREIGDAGRGDPEKTIAVIGPGTGFGASALVRDGGQTIAMAAEGGHASFAPDDDVECEILRVLSREFAHVSIERILSGPGLRTLHETLNRIEGIADGVRDPAEITRRALAGEEPFARTLMRFCVILGSVAGDFALYYGAQGGVYIAGGIAPAILPALEKSEFRRRFEAKGRFESYLRAIPTKIIIHTHAAFLGAAELARELAQ